MESADPIDLSQPTVADLLQDDTFADPEVAVPTVVDVLQEDQPEPPQAMYVSVAVVK